MRGPDPYRAYNYASMWLEQNSDSLTVVEYAAATLALEAERRMAAERKTPRRKQEAA